MILVVDRRNVTVRYERGTLVIEQPEQASRRVPVKQLEQFIVHGNPLIEASVWRALAEADVSAVILPHRGLKQEAFMGSGLASQLPFRRMQFQCAGHEVASLSLARWFIEQKLRSIDLPLLALTKHYPLSEDEAENIKTLRDTYLTKLATTEDLASIMGIEGQLAKTWFELLAEKLPASLNFTGRNRRPPRDPVNALLSLAYTLLNSEIHRGLISSGLDPSLGFLHQDYPGREALVLDFTEVFRSGVDHFVLCWLNETEIDKESFYYRESEGCRMSKSLRPEFYSAWAEYCEDWPRPFAPEADLNSWPTAPLSEQVNGQISRFREMMKTSSADNG